MKKTLIMTGIAVVLLIAVIAAALNAVFTVARVQVDFVRYSEAGLEDSRALQKKLDEKFVGRSTTFLDLEEVTSAVEEFPCFKVEYAQKDYPRTVVLGITERKELLSFRRENGLFAVLDEEGVWLYDKENNLNRLGGENILLDGFGITAEEQGKIASGDYFDCVLSFMKVFVKRYENPRANVVSFSLMKPDNALAGEYFLRLRMQEGVTVDLYSPTHLAEEKAAAVVMEYDSLSDAERLYGYFDVVDSVDGGFTVSKHRDTPPVGV